MNGNAHKRYKRPIGVNVASHAARVSRVQAGLPALPQTRRQKKAARRARTAERLVSG